MDTTAHPIRDNVFIAPNISIRASEGTLFYIGSDTNIQGSVILHGLKDGRVCVDKLEFSIFIGDNVNYVHGCIIHGRCKLEKHVFVGLNAIVFNALPAKAHRFPQMRWTLALSVPLVMLSISKVSI